MQDISVPCSLCGATGSRLILTHRNRDFYQCPSCDLVYVPSCFHATADEEKEIYDLHQNDATDTGYVAFLNRALTPLSTRLRPGMVGLDFGSGPTPVLSQMLIDSGYSMSIYDPHYADHPELLKHQYDFVTCTEVVEHFSTPYSAWKELVSLVRDDGHLVVMTLLHDSVLDFSTWWYKNDRTHVSFYSSRTIEWISKEFGLNPVYQDKDRVIMFERRAVVVPA